MSPVQQELLRLRGAAPAEISRHFFDSFGVVAQQHLDGKLWLFDYDQLAAHKHRTSPVVMESRGLVIDSESHRVIRRPFARFFNIGEASAYEADIDYARLEAQEKADGSLLTLYFNDLTDHWHFGTRGTPFADSNHRLGGRFYTRASKAAGLAAHPGTAEFDALVALVAAEKDTTYLFEFIGPDNPHVTPHPTSELVFLGARRRDGAELSPAECQAFFEALTGQGWNVRLPARYKIPLDLAGLSRQQQIEAIKSWVASAPDFKGLHEGVVCYDPVTGKRLKVKTPLYCAAHLQGDGAEVNVSRARIVELIVNGDAEEFCLYVPTLASLVQKAEQQVTEFLDSLAPVWEEIKDIEDQKEFALALQSRVSGGATALFFLARKSNTSPQQAWQSLPFNKQVGLAERVVDI